LLVAVSRLLGRGRSMSGHGKAGSDGQHCLLWHLGRHFDRGLSGIGRDGDGWVDVHEGGGRSL